MYSKGKTTHGTPVYHMKQGLIKANSRRSAARSWYHMDRVDPTGLSHTMNTFRLYLSPL